MRADPGFSKSKSVEKRRRSPAIDNGRYCASVGFLARQGFSVRHLRAADRHAEQRGTDPASELLACGAITQDAYYRSLARDCDIRYCARSDVQSLMTSGRPVMRANQAFARLKDGNCILLIAPRPRDLGRLLKLLSQPSCGERVGICSPETLRSLFEEHHGADVVVRVCDDLKTKRKHLSSFSGASFLHGFATATTGFFLLFSLLAFPSFAAAAFHAFIATFFFACVAIRAAAALTYRRQPYTKLAPVDPCDTPQYTVMVALRDEAALVPDLVRHLRALKWPRSKLQVLLVCEEDDDSTLDAIAREKLEPCFEVIRVPVCEPRTKPKALTYALEFTRGAFLTVYDAEDQPHPFQLVEAWQCFEGRDEELACVQAPLVTTNAGQSTISALFHLEYAGLFGALLPWIDRMGAPLLLGGTSNHFRTSALRKIGAWDPYNVTEDADVGLRLWRDGYKTGMITRPTLEPSSHRPMIWLRQRSRWFKGWLQTVIVHTTNPVHTWRALGPRATLVTGLLLFGTVVSALFHPFLLVAAIVSLFKLFGAEPATLSSKLIAWIDWSAILLSYCTFAALGWVATKERDRKCIGWRIWLIPLYWLGFSIAAWRAVRQLAKEPFLWEKTPH
ncbi:MAG: glycosyltransferase [Pseudomonadota bacterium]